MRRNFAVSLLLHGLCLLSANNRLLSQDSAGTADFEHNIRPLLLNHCGQCHGPRQQKGGLRLDARSHFFRGGDSGPVIVPGKSLESHLIQRITSADADLQMPPTGPRLTTTEIQLLQNWINAGADWPETEYDRQALIDPRRKHWSFQPLPASVSPPPADSRQHLTDIDRFLLDKLSPLGLSLNPRADRRILIRRAYLVITGLLPTPQQVADFVADESPNAWNNLIETLLSSPHYGERWAQHWLDVIRYADTHGFEVNTPRDNAWPYRDYVIRSLNSDKPWNTFVREQIAGDLLGEDAATGFLVASAVLLPGQIGADDASKRLARQDALDEIIAGTSSAVLGITLACARCHDHKFDPLTQQDYYSMQAFFAGVEYGERPLRDNNWMQSQQQAAALSTQIAELEGQVRGIVPLAAPNQLLLIDEEDSTRVRFLRSPNGPGTNPAGTQRGYRDDPGSLLQPGNLSNGRYTWWNNVPGEDVAVWKPALNGPARLWLSWGAHGSGVHTRDARCILDRDGDLTTRDDQLEIFKADQYDPAGVSSGTTEQTPQWSGFQYAGSLELNTDSAIILRGGDTGTGITADVIAFQRLPARDNPADNTPPPATPPLRDPVTPLTNIERFAPLPARFLRFTTFQTINNNQHEPCLDELEAFGPAQPQRNLAAASLGVRPTSSGNYSDIGIHQLPHINDGRHGNDFSWISSQLGGGWVQLEFPEIVELDTVVWSRDRTGKFLDRLPVRYSITVSADGVNWTTVADHSDRAPVGTPWDPQAALLRTAASSSSSAGTLVKQLQQLRDSRTKLSQTQMVFAGTFREPDRTRILRRGDPEQPADDVQPQIPQLFQQLPTSSPTSQPDHGALTPEQQRRLTLADWLASDTNPLTARVIVNRVWQHHFGLGLVETPNDFGLNGTPPGNQPLLDWLASELIRSGWSLKHLHRLILRSSAWQQDSALLPKGLELDRNNALLWHYSARRMETEAIRDCTLQVTGELNLKTGGPGFSFFQTRGGLSGFPEQEQFTSEEFRRMVYSHRVRMEQVPVFGAFDCPDFGQSIPRRSRSTTAIQALNLFNSRFTHDRAEALAHRLSTQAGAQLTAQLQLAWQLTLSRPPTTTELSAAETVAQQHGLPQVCRALLNSSEFLLIP
ncbi:MAG: DUF1553 domain-containing protein [Planctomyces sp.]